MPVLVSCACVKFAVKTIAAEAWLCAKETSPRSMGIIVYDFIGITPYDINQWGYETIHQHIPFRICTVISQPAEPMSSKY
jgi:hypothetical protein